MQSGSPGADPSGPGSAQQKNTKKNAGSRPLGAAAGASRHGRDPAAPQLVDDRGLPQDPAVADPLQRALSRDDEGDISGTNPFECAEGSWP